MLKRKHSEEKRRRTLPFVFRLALLVAVAVALTTFTHSFGWGSTGQNLGYTASMSFGTLDSVHYDMWKFEETPYEAGKLTLYPERPVNYTFLHRHTGSLSAVSKIDPTVTITLKNGINTIDPNTLTNSDGSPVFLVQLVKPSDDAKKYFVEKVEKSLVASGMPPCVWEDNAMITRVKNRWKSDPLPSDPKPDPDEDYFDRFVYIYYYGALGPMVDNEVVPTDASYSCLGIRVTLNSYDRIYAGATVTVKVDSNTSQLEPTTSTTNPLAPMLVTNFGLRNDIIPYARYTGGSSGTYVDNQNSDFKKIEPSPGSDVYFRLQVKH